jgi:hypothetical protein
VNNKHMLPILYNYPIYTEVNWRTLNIFILTNNVSFKNQIPYKTDLYWDYIFNYFNQ